MSEQETFYFFETWISVTSSLGHSHASTYRTSLAVSSTTISYSAYVVILGVCLRFKPHWLFQIYKYVIKGREELTSCSSLVHSYLFLLLDVLYRQVGNLSFWTLRCAEFVMAASNHIVATIQGARNTMPSAWHSELIIDLSYQRKLASYALSQLSSAFWLAGLETRDIQGIWLFKIVERCAR